MQYWIFRCASGLTLHLTCRRRGGGRSAKQRLESTGHGERKARGAIRCRRVVGPRCNLSFSRTATIVVAAEYPAGSSARNIERPGSTDLATQKRECCTACPTQPRADSAISRNLAAELCDAAVHAMRPVHQESCILAFFGGGAATREDSSKSRAGSSGVFSRCSWSARFRPTILPRHGPPMAF